MDKYEEFDEAVVAAVEQGLNTYGALFAHLKVLAMRLTPARNSASAERVLDRRLQALKKAGKLRCAGRVWTSLNSSPPAARLAVKAKPALYQLPVSTYTPEKYLLINLEDGTAFRGSRVAASEQATWKAPGTGNPVQVLRQAAAGTVHHRGHGTCPTDTYAGPDSRDDQCSVCQALVALDLAGA